MGHGLSDVVVVADGAPGSGLGHLARSTALVSALAELGRTATCLAHGAHGPRELDGVAWEPLGDDEPEPAGRLTVVDSYRRGGGDVRFHDEGPPPSGTRLLLGPLGGAPPAGGPPALTGLEHACLRRAFWSPRPRAVRDEVAEVLVTLGGAAPREDLATAARAATAGCPGATVRLVTARGPVGVEGVEEVSAPPALDELLARCDVVVTAAGQTLLEAAALGTPIAAVATASNQRPQLDALVAAGGARDAGDLAALGEALGGLRRPDARARLSAAAQRAVDGGGARRIARELDRLLGS